MSVTAVCEVTRKGGTSRKNHDVDLVLSMVPSLMSTRSFPKSQTGPGLGIESPTGDDNGWFLPGVEQVWSREPMKPQQSGLLLCSRGGMDSTVPSRQWYRLTVGTDDILKVFSCRPCGMPAASGLVIVQYLAVLEEGYN